MEKTMRAFTCKTCGKASERLALKTPRVCEDCQAARHAEYESKRYNPRPKLIEPEPGIRRCQTCEQDKPYSEYGFTNKVLMRHCKVCFLAKRANDRANNGREAEYAIQSVARRVDPAVTASRKLAQLKARRRKAAYAKIDKHFAAKRRKADKAALIASKPYFAAGLTRAERAAAKTEWQRENDKPAHAFNLFRVRVRKSMYRVNLSWKDVGCTLDDVLPMSRREYSLALVAAADIAFPDRGTFNLETGFMVTLEGCGGASKDALERLVALDNIRVESNLIEDKPWAVKGMRPHKRDKLRASLDPEFAIELRLRQRMRARSKGKAGIINKDVRNGVKGRSTNKATFRFVGYTPSELRIHIEGLFTPEMSWEAFMDARIHLDHIRPLASYDLTDEAQLKAAWAMSNLQPLWAEDNMKKGAKWDAPANDNEPLQVIPATRKSNWQNMTPEQLLLLAA